MAKNVKAAEATETAEVIETAEVTAEVTAAPVAPVAPAVITVIPATRDAEGILLEMNAKEFPKTKAGRVAYIDYQIEKLTLRKAILSETADPKAKAQQKRMKLLKQLEELEKMLSEDSGDTDENE